MASGMPVRGAAGTRIALGSTDRDHATEDIVHCCLKEVYLARAGSSGGRRLRGRRPRRERRGATPRGGVGGAGSQQRPRPTERGGGGRGSFPCAPPLSR